MSHKDVYRDENSVEAMETKLAFALEELDKRKQKIEKLEEALEAEPMAPRTKAGLCFATSIPVTTFLIAVANDVPLAKAGLYVGIAVSALVGVFAGIAFLVYFSNGD